MVLFVTLDNLWFRLSEIARVVYENDDYKNSKSDIDEDVRN